MESLDAMDEDDDVFLDFVDEFDDSALDQPECSASGSPLSQSENFVDQLDDPKPSPGTPASVTSLRRRRSGRSGISVGDSSVESSIFSDIDATGYVKKKRFRDRKWRISKNLNLKEKEQLDRSESVQELDKFNGVPTDVDKQGDEESILTTANGLQDGDSIDSVVELGDSSYNWLVSVAGFMIKAIDFQINLFVSFVTFPIWFFYNSYAFITDPFQTMRLGKAYIVEKLFKMWGIVRRSLSPVLLEWLKEHESIWNILLRCGWGLLWSSFVCLVLCSLLVSALVISGLFMRKVVQEPIQIKETLSFDYTKHNPVAYMLISACPCALCDTNSELDVDMRERNLLKAIPRYHKLQATVSLTLPESEYNRNLGVFQVRVDFLSATGKVLAGSSHPCMLKFKSEPIRLLLTFLKIAPLVTGYASESQTLNLKIRGFTEGNIPTACVKVTIRQRAEYRPGAGIPEVYDASIILESELPLVGRVIWNWKKTIFVWISMLLFIMELLFTLVFCSPFLIRKIRREESITSSHREISREEIF